MEAILNGYCPHMQGSGIVLHKISIITPTLNSERYLPKLIDSVLRQGYDNYEHIFIDGGSVDNTLGIIDDYMRASPGLVRVLIRPGLFVGSAVREGLKCTSGDIIGWIDSDDVYSWGAWRKVIDVFDMVEGVNFVYGDSSIIDGDGLIRGYYHNRGLNVREAARGEFNLHLASAFYRKSLLDKIGYVDDIGNHMGFYMKAAEYGGAYYLDQVLSSWRRHEGQYSNEGHPLHRWLVGEVLKRNFRLGLKYGGSLWSKRSMRYYRYLLFDRLGVYRLRRR